MNNIDELIEIIKNLGSFASLNDICNEYSKENGVALSSNHRIIIARTLSENPQLVNYDETNNKWKVIQNNKANELEQTNKSFYNFDFYADDVQKRCENSQKLINKFISKYPANSIKSLSFDDYAFIQKDKGNNESFCGMLRRDLQPVCSMGNAFPATFEIYKNPSGKIKFSSAYEKEFNGDLEQAFKILKNRIFDFIVAAEDRNTIKMNTIKLNSAFKQKLASVYCRDIYFPCAVKDYTRDCCNRLNISFNEENIFNSMIDLGNWKKQYLEISMIDNNIAMQYADFLINNNLTMNKNDLLLSNGAEWILSANPNVYDYKGAFNKYSYIDWRQTNNYKVGDIIYIYSSKQVHKIAAICRVTKVDLEKRGYNDAEFWKNGVDNSKDKKRFFRIILIKQIDDERLRLDTLLEHGLSVAPQVACRVNEELSKYIHNVINL